MLTPLLSNFRTCSSFFPTHTPTHPSLLTSHTHSHSLSLHTHHTHTGEIRDNLEAGVVEPAISKIKSLRFATEAAIAILRIDDMVKLNVHKQQGH